MYGCCLYRNEAELDVLIQTLRNVLLALRVRLKPFRYFLKAGSYFYNIAFSLFGRINKLVYWARLFRLVRKQSSSR